MSTKTLRELCDTLGVSRRAVQGYEKYGLVSSSSKNERGYLLYDDDAQSRIQTIYQFQRFGFKVKEIGELLNVSKHQLKMRLKQQRDVMLEQKEGMDSAIRELSEMIDRM